MSTPQARLIADIGGTNARFALTDADGLPYHETVLSAADYPTLVDAIGAYLNSLSQPRPREAALAVAMPITGDQVTFTNNTSWSFSIEQTRQTLGLERLLLVNDFTALALALPRLQTDECRPIGAGEAVPEAPIGLIGPGTGLGVSGLIWSGQRWIPLQSEGGHVTFSPYDALEWEIACVLSQRFGHVSAERLLSGPGLVNIYTALAEVHGRTEPAVEPADITAQAISGSSPHCRQALEIFCSALGTTAGNLAITLGARGGVYIGGGIVPRLGEFFERSAFRARFEAKGRFVSYLAAIPTWVIIAAHPALRGAAAVLDA